MNCTFLQIPPTYYYQYTVTVEDVYTLDKLMHIIIYICIFQHIVILVCYRDILSTTAEAGAAMAAPSPPAVLLFHGGPYWSHTLSSLGQHIVFLFSRSILAFLWPQLYTEKLESTKLYFTVL